MDLQSFFVQNSTEQCYRELILGSNVWYFENLLKMERAESVQRYDDMRYYLSHELKIHFNNIAIVGSGKTGFSFKRNLYRPFRVGPMKTEEREVVGGTSTKLVEMKASDMDIAVVHPKLFALWWSHLARYTTQRHLKDYAYITGCIFRGFVVASFFPDESPFPDVKAWKNSEGEAIRGLQTRFEIEHDVSFRIYDSWDGIRNYHEKAINKAKQHFGQEGSN